MERIPQSTAKRVLLKAYLSSDHLSVATGKTLAVTLSKNGGAFANPSAGATNASEIGNGWYYFDASTTDTGTLGPLIVRATAATVDDVEIMFDVVADLATVTAIKAKTDNLPADPASAATIASALTPLSNLDATVSSRLASSSYAAPANSDIAAIKTKTDSYLDAAVSSRLASGAYTAPANADIAAIKAKTDNLPSQPAAVGSAMTLTADYDAAKTVVTAADLANAINEIKGAGWTNETLVALDALLTSINGAVGGASEGAVKYSDTITATGSGNPIPGVDVWVTNGAQVIASTKTDAFGYFEFLLDPGTYTLHAQLAGYNASTSTIEVA